MTNLSATCHANAAITILNATATGRGCSLAVAGGIQATWTWRQEPGIHLNGDAPDDHLARAVLRTMRARFPKAPAGAWVSTESTFPPSRGLKTSSSSAAALLRAAHKAIGESLDDLVLLDLAVGASLEAKVTLTGAYDDQVAAVRGGCHLTDNRRRIILAAIAVQPWDVAIWVPDRSVPKAALADVDARAIASDIEAAEVALQAGDIPAAMTRNGAAFHELYRAHDLPVDDRPVQVALDAGALGAGLSGTGPAVAALFDQRVELAEVEGGHWTWTRPVEAT